jgi:hypothetical protein
MASTIWDGGLAPPRARRTLGTAGSASHRGAAPAPDYVASMIIMSPPPPFVSTLLFVV